MAYNFYYAPTIAEVVVGASGFSRVISTQGVALGLSQAQIERFAELAERLEQSHSAAEEPTTRTSVAIAARNTALAEMRAEAMALSRIVTANRDVDDAQLVSLGLLPRRARVRHGRPTERPGVHVESVVGRTVSILVHGSGGTRRRGKPSGVAAAWVYAFVGPEYPSDPLQWQFRGATTRASMQITFRTDVPAGSQVWVRAAWINAKQEVGPLGEPVTTYLQLGGVESAPVLRVAA